MKKLSIVSVVFLLLVGCGEKTAKGPAVFNVAEMTVDRSGQQYAVVQIDKKLFADINESIDTVVYICLSSKRPIGNIDKAAYNNGFYYILDKGQDCIHIFSEQGEYVKRIRNKGRAHNEYLAIGDFVLRPTKDELIVFDHMNCKLIAYDLAGNYKWNKMLDLDATGFQTIADSAFVFATGSWQNAGTSMEKYTMAVMTEGSDSLKAAIPWLPVQVGYTGEKSFAESNRVLFRPLYSDTLYNINGDGTYGIAYHIDRAGGSAWEKDWDSKTFKILFHEDNCTKPWFYETDDFLKGYTSVGKTKDDRRMSMILYNRKTGQTKLLRPQNIYEQASMDKYEGSDWVGIREDGWFINQIDPVWLLEKLEHEAIKSGRVKIPEPLQKVINQLKEDSNPALVLVKYK